MFDFSSCTDSNPTPAAKPALKGKGMSLGKASSNKTNDFLKALQDEGEIQEVQARPSAKGMPSQPAAPAVHTERCTLQIVSLRGSMKENPSIPVFTLPLKRRFVFLWRVMAGCKTLKSRAISSSKLQQQMRDLSEFIFKGRIRPLSSSRNATAFFQTVIRRCCDPVNFQTHPNINKQLYSAENVLGHKDASRAFPAGNALGILKWRMQTKDESLLPISSTIHRLPCNVLTQIILTQIVLTLFVLI